MFSSIGIGELAVICIVLIIAVGPERLPTMMKTMGKTMRTLRQASRDIRSATGIDEMMRDDMFDMNERPRPYKQPPGPGVSRTPQVTAPPVAAPLESGVAASSVAGSVPQQATTPSAPGATAAPHAPAEPERDATTPVVTGAK